MRKKLLVVACILLMCGMAQAKELRMGIASDSDKTDTYIAMVLAKYTGDALDGNLAQCEPAISLGLLDYENLDIYELKETAQPILDISVNIVKVGEFLPLLGKLFEKIPEEWIFAGAGCAGEWRDLEQDVKLRGKWVLAIKREF